MDDMESSSMDSPRHGRLLHIAQWLRNVRVPAVTGKTVDTYLSEISAAHARLTGYHFVRSKLLTDYMTRIKQLPPPAPNAKSPRLIKMPVTKDMLRSIVADSSVPSSIAVACVFGFDAMLRIEEFTSPSHTFADTRVCLLRSDVVIDQSRQLITVRIKKSKSDPAFQGPQFSIANTTSFRSLYTRLVEYIQDFDTRYPPDSPLFRREQGDFVTRADIDDVIKTHARKIGLNPEQYSCHGLRFGGAFELAESYVQRSVPIDWESIIARGRWHGTSANTMAQHYARFSSQRLFNIEEALDLERSGATALPILH